MPQKRAVCQNCSRPITACLCRYVIKVDHKTEVLILQHYSETKNAKNTAKLLQLCLSNCRIESGEVFTPDVLGVAGGCALVYPDDGGGRAISSEVDLREKDIRQLLMIDGTWRKSRKILHLNPWLKALPRYSLQSITGNYRIRKAEKEGQLSTLEAGALALSALEANEAIECQLLKVFENFLQDWERFAEQKSDGA